MSRKPRRAATRASAAPGPHPSPAPWWPYALTAAAGIAVYANALHNPLVFDDAGSITDNPTIHSLATSVRGGPVQFPTAGRPLVNLAFAINYALGGDSPFGYHLVNLAMHIACALLIVAIVRRTAIAVTQVRPALLAAAVGLLWVVHPLTSEIVDYVTQRTEVMMAFACLTTLYTALRAMTAPAAAEGRWYALSIAACAAGMACKESMAVTPVLVLLFDSAFFAGNPVAAVRRRPIYYAMLAATWILLAVLIVEGPRWRSAGFATGVSPWTYLLNQAPLILRYLRLAMWPSGLVLDYGEPVQVALAAVWPALAAVTVLGIVALAAWRWSPAIGFLATWIFITLAPTSSFLPIATEVGAERRMYLPLAGLAVLAAILFDRAAQRLAPSRREAAGMGAAAIVAAMLAVITIERNTEYASGLRIWQTVVDRRPQGRARYNLGLELKKAGRRADAIEQYRLALATSADAHYAYGFELGEDGQYEDAIAHYREYIRQKPGDVNVLRAYHQLGRALVALGQRDEAAQAFREVLTRRPGDTDALGGLADTLLALDRNAEAVAAYQDYLRRRPQDPTALFNMGLALVKLDRDAEARGAFAAVVQLEPNNVAAHVNLAYALANTNQYGEALREFRRAAELETDPAGRASIEQAIGQLLAH
jgi:tetratricopeptide (TPR) repeat protein